MNSKKAVEGIMKVLGLKHISFFEAQTEQGMMMKMEGELEVGAPIYIATEEGLIPAPPGMHKLDDGTEIEVDEEGKVKKINMGEMEKQETEDVKKEDEDAEIVKKDQEMSDELFGDVELVDGTVIRMEGETEIVGRRVMKVGYDGTLSAIADGQYETKGGKVLQIVGGSIQGVQSVADNEKRKTGFADGESYDWDKCMSEQLAQYGDEETAAKVCGAIKAGNMAAMFVEAETYDGAIVESKTFDVGEDIFLVTNDGKEKAPDGEHQIKLRDSEGKEVKIRVMVKDGKITERENVEEESEMEKMAAIFASQLKSIQHKLDIQAAKQKELESRFEKFSKAPAGSRVYTQKVINEKENPLLDKFEAFKKLRANTN